MIKTVLGLFQDEMDAETPFVNLSNELPVHIEFYTFSIPAISQIYQLYSQTNNQREETRVSANKNFERDGSGIFSFCRKKLMNSCCIQKEKKATKLSKEAEFIDSKYEITSFGTSFIQNIESEMGNAILQAIKNKFAF